MSLPVFKLNAQASHSICHVIDSLSAFLFWLCSLLFHCHWWAFSHFLTGFKICQPITDGVLQEGRWQPLYLPVGDILSPEGCVSFQQLMVRTLLPPFSLIAFLPSTAFFQFCTIPFSAFDMKVSQFTTCLWVLKFPGEWINAGTDFSGGFRVHFMEQGRGVCSEPSYTNYDNNLSSRTANYVPITFCWVSACYIQLGWWILMGTNFLRNWQGFTEDTNHTGRSAWQLLIIKGPMSRHFLHCFA